MSDAVAAPPIARVDAALGIEMYGTWIVDPGAVAAPSYDVMQFGISTSWFFKNSSSVCPK